MKVKIQTNKNEVRKGIKGVFRDTVIAIVTLIAFILIKSAS
jgi:hypothetical protein